MSDQSSTPAQRVPADRSRVVRLDAGQVRAASANLPTCLDPRLLAKAPGRRGASRRVPFEALFLEVYPQLRSLGRGLREPGVLVAAVDIERRRLAGRLWLRASPGAVRAAIVGRHSRCDLMLPGRLGLSLRHLAVLLHPLRSWEGSEVRFSVVDLRTGTAFHDEAGRQLEGLRAAGPALVSCGGVALIFLQTGEGIEWPKRARGAWAALPERVYLDERGAEPDRWARRAPAGRPAPRPDWTQGSFVAAIPGPLRADEVLLGPGEERLGVVRILRPDGAGRRLEVGPAALDRGVVFGRYARCDSADLFGAASVSRVHLLLVRVGATLHMIDTASTYGTHARDGEGLREVRAAALAQAGGVWLAEGAVAVRWRSDPGGSERG